MYYTIDSDELLALDGFTVLNLNEYVFRLMFNKYTYVLVIQRINL